MGLEPTLCICVCVTTNTMLNFDGDFDVDTNAEVAHERGFNGRICIYLLQGAASWAESERRGRRHRDATVQRAEERRQSGRWRRILHEHLRDVSVCVSASVGCSCVSVCVRVFVYVVCVWDSLRLTCPITEYYGWLPGADPGFPVGGDANPPGGGANIWFCQILWKTAWNWGNFGP